MEEIKKMRQSAIGRIIAGFVFALAVALSAFLVITFTKGATAAFGSIWFLAILPAILCGLIAYIGDPELKQPKSFYYNLPIIFVVIVCAASAVFLGEGIICILMLAPFWIGAGIGGAFAVRNHRLQTTDNNKLHASFIFLPLLGMIIETNIPVFPARETVSRQIIINASPSEIWPFTVANQNIGEAEGRWNFTQNIVGLPRPRATTVSGTGAGAIRTAFWGDKINFEEIITVWEPAKTLGWKFNFMNSSVQDYTDKHISPDGEFLRIDTGEYIIRPIGDNKTMLVLNTHYIAKTHVNFYSAIWGEILLGDVQNNVLALIKVRVQNAKSASVPNK